MNQNVSIIQRTVIITALTVFFQLMHGGDIVIPAKIQVALINKIFNYSTALAEKENINILLTYNNNTRSLAQDITKAFASIERVNIDAVTEEQFDLRVNKYDVVYIMPEMDHLAPECHKLKKLTISCVPQLAKNGTVAIAVGLVNDLPRVFINIKSLETEGHSVSAKLLQIAEVYK